MSYKTYADIRDLSWEYLIKYEICSLPVDIMRIANGENFHVVKNSYADALRPGETARSYFDGNIWHIIYDDSQPKEKLRFALAHEIGHAALHHELKYLEYGHLRIVNPKPISENQANQFAMRLLCPACFIYAMELHTPEEIAKACLVDIDVATVRAQRMKILRKRNMFLTSPLEQLLYKNFKEQLLTQNQNVHKS